MLMFCVCRCGVAGKTALNPASVATKGVVVGAGEVAAVPPHAVRVTAIVSTAPEAA